MNLSGIGASSGIGMGRLIMMEDHVADLAQIVSQGADIEMQRLDDAVAVFCEQTELLAQKMEEQVGNKESEILRGQIAILKDPYMLDKIRDHIRSGLSSEAAVDSVCSELAALFEDLEDEMIRQRATDIRDVRNRILKVLQNVKDTDISDLPEGTVLWAKDFSPSMTAAMDRAHVAALISETGGQNSHTAIIARTIGIPAVLGVGNVVELLTNGDTVIVDGSTGKVVVNPSDAEKELYAQKQKQYRQELSEIRKYLGKETASADGRKYKLYANIGSIEDAQQAFEMTAEGIGLFRTELIYMNRSHLPTENEQYEIYCRVSEIMEGRELIIRTLDIGGDKQIDCLGIELEENPFLGFRAIRYCLERQDIFKAQLRAILRAGAKNRNIKIMLPLVTSLKEVLTTKALISDLMLSLSDEKLDFDENISLGVMIETPAAVQICDILAKNADFFSIGTNDLIQYTMAADRGNPKVEYLYSAYNPAVIRSINQVIRAAKSAGIEVGMCGEAASDENLIPLWMSLGLDEFSVNPSSILKVRKIISLQSAEKMKKISGRLLEVSTEEEAEELLLQFKKGEVSGTAYPGGECMIL